MEINNKSDPARISHTAVMCAKYLARDSAESIPYAKDIWDKLKTHDENVVKEGKNNFCLGILMSFPGMSKIMTMLEGRYVAINNVLANENYPSVIELASGLSPRGLDFTRKDPNQIYIETDLPDLQKIKKNIVEQIRGEEKKRGFVTTPNYHLNPLNILNKEEFTRAIEPYVNSKKDKPLAIVHAGLWMYLDSDEQKKARDNIADILREHSPNGMWITPDFKQNFIKNPLLKILTRRVEKKTKRKVAFYESEEDIIKFLTEGGFKVESISSAYIVDSLSCVKKRGLNVKKARQDSHRFDIHKITLA